MTVNSRPRILFMGTPDFAVPSLLSLLADDRVEVVGVVTQPDRPKGRKQVLTPPPVKAEAVQRGLPVFQPEKLRAPDNVERLKQYAPDLIVTAAYGQILPKAVLDMPRLGCVNVHASLLPKYRGGAPIHRSIIDGERETGVTIMYMAEGLDTGDMISRVVVPIDEHDTTGTLHDKLSVAGAELLKDTIGSLLSGEAKAVPQDDAAATYAPNLSRDDERIDWAKTSRQIYNQVRGLHPWPVAFTVWEGDVFKVWMCRVLREGEADRRSGREPGTVIRLDESGIEVATGDGSVLLTDIQPAGKKRMSAQEFARGSRMEQGTRLGGALNR